MSLLHQGHFTARNFTHTQLGTLQIRQDSGVRAQFSIDAAHGVNGRAMHFVGAMGKLMRATLRPSRIN